MVTDNQMYENYEELDAYSMLPLFTQFGYQ